MKDLKITSDELISNFKKWNKIKGNNILFITGLSGSGKSTRAEELCKTYSAEHICLDDYEHASKHFCKYADEFMDLHPKYKELSEKNWKNTQGDNLINEFYEGATLYFKWLMKKCRADYKKLFIIEGIQLFGWGSDIESHIKNQPIIIKLTKPEECRKRIVARDVNNTDAGQHDLPKLIRHYNYLTYFIKRIGIEYDLNAYDPPLNVEEIKRYYPEKAAVLLKDPVHKWRAETGIELIHEEPSVDEQKRIWDNWQKMTDSQKKISDKKCKELTGLNNEELHYKIMKEKWGIVMNEEYKVGDKFILTKKGIEVTVVELDSNVYQCVDKFGNPHAVEMDTLDEDAKIFKKTLYHGSGTKYETLKPMAYDLGNLFQEPGWSLFCFDDKKAAITWGLFTTLRNIREANAELKLKYYYNPGTKKIIITQRNFDEILKFEITSHLYVFKIGYGEFSLGNDSNHNEFTVRKEIIPDEHYEITFNASDLRVHSQIVSDEEMEKFKLDYFNGKFINKGAGLKSVFLIHDFSLNKDAVKCIKTALSDGSLEPGGDIKALLKKNKVAINRVSILDRLKIEVSNLFDNTSIIVESSGVKKFPIFVVLTSNPTLMGDTIRSLTNSEYNHASISVDPTMSEMFSFSFKSIMDNGFVEESMANFAIFNGEKDEYQSKYAIFCTLVSQPKYERLLEMLESFKANVNNYRYNFIGLFNFLTFKRSKKSSNALFCSEFVSEILKDIDISLSVSQTSNLVKPDDLSSVEKFKLLTSGVSAEFDPDDLQKKLTKFIRSKESMKFFTENSAVFNIAMLSNLTTPLNTEPVFKTFAPSMIDPWRVMTGKSFGSLFTDILQASNDDEIKSSIEIFATSTTNKYGVLGYDADIDRLKYRVKLHDVITSLFSEWNTPEQLKAYEEIISEWESQVQFTLKKPMAPETRKQTLYELFWNPDDEFTEENKNKNRLKIDLFYEICINSINEDSFFDRSDSFSSLYTNLPDDVYLLPSCRKYPILNGTMLLIASDYFVEGDPTFSTEEFVENFIKFYKEFRCKFTVNQSNPLYKYVKSILPEECVTDSLTTKSDRDNFLSRIFTTSEKIEEAAISKTKYNFEIDSEGNIMISEKENADFELHYRDSLRLLKIYKREANIEGIKKELCRIYYMVKMLEILLLVEDTNTDDRKRIMILRAKMLSSFSQYMSIVIKAEKDFDFDDYFQKSPYGAAIIINIQSLEGTMKIANIFKILLSLPKSK